MNFPFNAYLLAFAAAFLTTLLSLPLWRRFCHRTGHVDEPGHRKIHGQPIALAGGLAVATGILLPVLAGAVLLGINIFSTPFEAPLTHGLGRRVTELLAILAGAVGMVALGWIDDKHTLRPSVKFGGQLLIAVVVAASGVRITLFVPDLAFSYFVTILWILTLINAFNFMDNMNGLCTGLGFIGATGFALAAAARGQYLVACLALLGCGALLGFLPYNFPRASAFLGDAGSHLVGYLMAVLAILPHFYTAANPRALDVLDPLLILAVPLVDLIWVVILRTRMGRPFWIGDTNHLSHRLVRAGLTQSKAVLLIWLIAAALAAFATLY